MAVGKTQKIQQQWINIKTLQESKQLQKHADNMNMKPIWAYAERIRKENVH